MKFKFIIATVLGAMAFAACSNDKNEGTEPVTGDYTKAFVSLNVVTPTSDNTRAPGSSDEQNGTPTESDIKSLYVVLFDADGKISSAPNATLAYTKLVGTDLKTPDVFEVSSKAKSILIFANPGTALLTKIQSAAKGTSFNAFNAAITGVTATEVTTAATGFTMTNAEGLVDISANVKVVGDGAGQYPTDQAAKDEATKPANRKELKIERISAKVAFDALADNAITVTTTHPNPAVAKFSFTGWQLDLVNGVFYPLAEKVELTVPHTGTFYQKNFYTIDPNYTDGTGLIVNSTASLPAWKARDTDEYVLENTMSKEAQNYENATRLIVKATYYPENTWTADWFSYAGLDYETLADLQVAYAIPSNVALQTVCDQFLVLAKTASAKAGNTLIPAGITFETLTQAHLNGIANGGEETKGDSQGLRWYQGGLCYYFYVLRHDNTANMPAMALGKYGVVRNNWYDLNLTKVNGAGTPWYPTPGPGPIDELNGYLGITVNVAPWVYWSNDIEI